VGQLAVCLENRLPKVLVTSLAVGQNLSLVAWVHPARLPICHTANHGKDLTASSCKGERSLQLANAKS
jgi:hypothetical protein